METFLSHLFDVKNCVCFKQQIWKLAIYHFLIFCCRFEQAFLSSSLNSKSGMYWTDATNLVSPGTFKNFDNNKEVLYTNWAPNRPGNEVYKVVELKSFCQCNHNIKYIIVWETWIRSLWFHRFECLSFLYKKRICHFFVG